VKKVKAAKVAPPDLYVGISPDDPDSPVFGDSPTTVLGEFMKELFPDSGENNGYEVRVYKLEKAYTYHYVPSFKEKK